MALIELNNISKTYGSGDYKIVALDNINLKIERQEFVVILGASGAGKSTLLNILGGMDRPTSGSYIVDNRNICDLNNKEMTLFRRNDIGFVFQFYNLMPNLTAYENVLLASQTVKNSLDSKETLSMVGLGKRLDNFPSGLSGGEQQRVSIARAIVKNPLLLLCDEPTGALDSKTGKAIIKLLKSLCEEANQTVVIVTHNAKIASIANRIIRISDGKIINDEINSNPLGVDDIEW